MSDRQSTLTHHFAVTSNSDQNVHFRTLVGIINGYPDYPSVVDDIKELVAQYVTVSTSLLLRVLYIVDSVKRQTLPCLCDPVKAIALLALQSFAFATYG